MSSTALASLPSPCLLRRPKPPVLLPIPPWQAKREDFLSFPHCPVASTYLSCLSPLLISPGIACSPVVITSQLAPPAGAPASHGQSPSQSLCHTTWPSLLPWPWPLRHLRLPTPPAARAEVLFESLLLSPLPSFA